MPSRKADKITKTAPRRWSQHVTETSKALDLDAGVFSWSDRGASQDRSSDPLRRASDARHRRVNRPCQY
jgi:hypothetical protein